MARKTATYRGDRRDLWRIADQPWGGYTLPTKTKRQSVDEKPAERGVNINTTRLLLAKAFAEATTFAEKAKARFSQVMFRLDIRRSRQVFGPGRSGVTSQKCQDRSRYLAHQGVQECARRSGHAG